MTLWHWWIYRDHRTIPSSEYLHQKYGFEISTVGIKKGWRIASYFWSTHRVSVGYESHYLNKSANIWKSGKSYNYSPLFISAEAACSNQKELSHSVFFNILHLYNKMSLHMDDALQFKTFSYVQFCFSLLLLWETGPASTESFILCTRNRGLGRWNDLHQIT